MEDIIIIAPDGSEVVFPAGTPDSVIEAAMKAEYGGAESADLYGDPQNGPTDITGWGPNERLTLKKGDYVFDAAYNNGEPFTLDEDPTVGTPEIGATSTGPYTNINPPRQVGALEDVARSVPTGLAEGLTSIAGLPALVRDATHWGAEKARGALGIEGEGPEIPVISPVQRFLQGLPERIYPTTPEIDRSVQNVIGGYYQPQTTAGEYARAVGQNATNALIPGSAGLRVASVVAPAVVGETAGQIGRDIDERANQRSLSDLVTGEQPQRSNIEPWARAIGGLAGATGVGLASAVRGGSSGVLRNATQGVDDQQLALAEALRGRSPVPLSGAEAIQQVTGGSTGLGRVQRVVEGATPSGPLTELFSQRPQAVRSAVDSTLERIAPAQAPQAVAGQAQEAASGVLNTMRQRVNENAQPFYDRLPGQTLSPEGYAQLADNPSYAMAEQAVRGNPELAALMSGAPEDLSSINRVVQQLDQMQAQATPGQMNPQGNMTVASQRGQAADLARALASEASPDFAMARLTGATGREAFVDPLKRGPIGAIANQAELQPNLSEQTSALFSPRPFEGAADETTQALRLMSEIDPSVGPSLVRQHLASGANEALQQNMAGPNQFGGAKLAAQLFGNPEQERALLGAVDTVSPMASRDVRDLVEGLRATGTRETGNSNTSFNEQLLQDMRGGNLGQGVISTAVNPTGIFRRGGEALDNAIARRNSEGLARLLAGPQEDLNAAIVAARSLPRGTNRTRLLAALLQSQEQE